MAKQLEKLIDKSMKFDEDKIQSLFSNEEADVYAKAIKEKIYKEVYDEIKEEAIQEITHEATKRVKKINSEEKIKSFVSLTITGVILAFFIGLTVNETTAFIDYLKSNDTGWQISLFVVVLSIIVISLITVFVIIKEAIKFISR